MERLRVRVKANARTSAVLKVADGIMYVAIAAPPAEGKANMELERFLSKLTGKKAKVKSGFTSKDKVVLLT